MAIIILLIIYIIWLGKKGESLIKIFEGFSYLYPYFGDGQILSPLIGTAGNKRYDFSTTGRYQ